MGKIKKKGTSGQAKNFITRTQAVRKLQISLPDFRRLCIFKGIYPREPRNKKKASKSATPSTTFYYTRDIQYLLHEPLLKKFREQKALAKKIARALGRGEVGSAARLEKNNAPKLSLDHIIKERYPTFIDALRDLDDALSLLFLFANLPSTTTVPPKTITLCQRLCHEFQHYLIATNSLRKSFLSIKGIYYQATIQGQDIMWLVPYRFVQRVTGDVDYRIMGTFVEFYTTLLGFVNHRLYTTIGLVYPPKFDKSSDERGAELAAFTLEGRNFGETQKAVEGSQQLNGSTEKEAPASKDLQAKVDNILEKTKLDTEPTGQATEAQEENTDAIDTFEPIAPEADTLPQPQISGDEAGSLFAPFTFYISREAPRAPLEFLLRSFGCKRIGWDSVLGDGAFTQNELDPRITHQIVDRPQLPESALPLLPKNPEDGTAALRVRPGTRVPGRTYVQPQWVWDCINEGRLLRPDLYAPGATLPPHLSPWVKPSKGGYDPRASLADQEEEGEAERAAEAEEYDDDELEESEDEAPKSKQSKKLLATLARDSDDEEASINGGMDIAMAEDTDESSDDGDDADEFEGFDQDEDMSSESEDEEEKARSQHQKELEAEAAGLPFSAASQADNGAAKSEKQQGPLAKKRAAQKKKEEEELERQKMMMSRKKRKLLDKMIYSNKKQDAEAEKLRQKRRKIEQSLKK
ncbi:mRNA-binding ribosome synthesis protein nop7 [Blastomyces dermatitidis]|uniref:Pescadillo homolog n=3 Tax=Blastomyces TaxID=229219 RepID=A0A179UDQ0_BLAGS|nr:pescadillo [Blastomyces gilchristii SLH14081]XP_045275243.1 pescadillo [Blastomyces dermatitidis ER-3]EGE79579.1 pescadillo [Blastomyces dermatitidis ATCC 18188]EQL32574.1 pescadillo [Blastomyces dermatitidis ATCC 26199]EEQ88019.1 pescadillo [Blastomyces dermatitidis ER-3]OAT06136.1 pescadillo [Blastomyces gilchristii SLH14081]